LKNARPKNQGTLCEFHSKSANVLFCLIHSWEQVIAAENREGLKDLGNAR
jgi:hypothetical protein